MTARVLITGAPHDVAEALRTMRAWNLTVTADPVMLASALDELRERGHQVVEDARLSRKILLELTPQDLRRLQLLDSADYSHVLAAARHVIHEHLDELIVAPACPHCAPQPSGI